MSANRRQVVIVGAGPYGLALAAHLRAQRVPFRIFGRPMGSWRDNMPPGMLLKSELFASSIAEPSARHTLRAFYDQTGRDPEAIAPVSLETFCEYGLWFAGALVDDVEEVRVERVAGQPGGGFTVSLETGEEFGAAAVVLAVGHLSFPHVPAELRELPPALLSHSSAYGDLKPLMGKRVAVVGAGQSALETAYLLNRAGGSATVVARTPQLLWNPPPPEEVRRLRSRFRQPMSALGPGWRALFYSELPQAFWRLPEPTRLRLVGESHGPAGAWWLHEPFEGVVPVKLGRHVAGARAVGGGAGLQLDSPGHEPEELLVDHIVVATGYKVDMSRLELLDPGLLAAVLAPTGSPVLNRRFETTVPGLFAIGLAAAASFGPVMRFVYGSGFAARRVLAALSRLSIHPSGSPPSVQA